MRRRDRRARFQISNRSRHLDHPVAGARGETEATDRRLEERQRLGIERAEALQEPRTEFGVGGDAGGTEATRREGASGQHPPLDRFALTGGGRDIRCRIESSQHLVGGQSSHLDM